MSSKKSYKHVIVNWDGCLARTQDVVLAEFKNSLESVGIFTTPEEIIKHAFGKWFKGIEYFGVTDQETFLSSFVEAVNKKTKTPKLYRGAKSFLCGLKKAGIAVCVLTTEKQEWVIQTAKKLKVDSKIDCYFVKKGKGGTISSGKNLIEAIKKLDGNKKHTLFVGNSPKDVLKGRKAGIDTIIFYPPENSLYYSRQSFNKLGKVRLVEKFSDILDLL